MRNEKLRLPAGQGCRRRCPMDGRGCLRLVSARDRAPPCYRRELVAWHHQPVSKAEPLYKPGRPLEPTMGAPGRPGGPGSALCLSAGRIHRPRQVSGGHVMAKVATIIHAVEGVTKKWTKQRKAEERAASARRNRLHVLTRQRTVSLKAAAWKGMEAAYLKASAGGTLPANARQIMYAGSPAIQGLADRPLDDQYFTQTLLPDYIEEKGVDWDVVFDARGRMSEPHTDEEVPLGTLQVRNYFDVIGRHKVGDLSWNVWEDLYPTRGPQNRYG